tara:strand:- start:153 stop:515 length:363 start_codon:yes stop_codon:yes gene_type:complete
MKDALKRWIDLVSVQDIEGVVDLYSNDGLLLGTFSDEIRVGKDKIRDYFEFFLAKKPKALLVDSIMHIIDDNSCTFNGFYDFEVDGLNGKRKLAHARFTFVFKKQDSGVKILSHHSSVMP